MFKWVHNVCGVSYSRQEHWLNTSRIIPDLSPADGIHYTVENRTRSGRLSSVKKSELSHSTSTVCSQLLLLCVRVSNMSANINLMLKSWPSGLCFHFWRVLERRIIREEEERSMLTRNELHWSALQYIQNLVWSSIYACTVSKAILTYSPVHYKPTQFRPNNDFIYRNFSPNT